MAVFSYRSTDLDGIISEGTIEALDERTALERLKHSGLIPLKITARKDTFGKFSFRSKKDLFIFTSELSSLLGAGLPLDSSLQILFSIAENKEMAAVIQSILKSVREGNSLSEALQRHPDVFSNLYINMVRAGEAGGVLDSVLARLTEFLEAAREMKSHILSAMVYPLILVITGILSIIILLTFVLPRFAVIFSELGGSIPVTTQLLLSISNFLQLYGWLVVSVAVGGWLFARRYIRTGPGRYRWDALKLRLWGDLIGKMETAVFCRTLGTLLKSGVPLIQALHNAREIVRNRVIATSLDEVVKGVKQGMGLSSPLAATERFPALAISMIKVGEEIGQLDKMLIKTAETYEKGMKETVKRFIGILEPALILIMGLMIGFIVVSMLSAVFSIIDLPL